MALLEIIEAPHPILAAKAREVREEEFGAELEQRLADMAETMYAAPGVGLAAPQVSDSRRIIVADPGEEDSEGGTRRKRGEQFVAMVNPAIVAREGQLIWEESCLSVPEFTIDVTRARRIHVRWRDGRGEAQDRWFEDFPAIVIQHELDHLEGVTLLDRASRLKRSRYVARKRKRVRLDEDAVA